MAKNWLMIDQYLIMTALSKGLMATTLITLSFDQPEEAYLESVTGAVTPHCLLLMHKGVNYAL